MSAPLVNGTQYSFRFRVVTDFGGGTPTGTFTATPTAGGGGNNLTETRTDPVGVTDTVAVDLVTPPSGIILRPNGAAINGTGWVASSGTMNNSWQLVNDDPYAPDDSGFVRRVTVSGTPSAAVAWLLTDTPAEFVSASEAAGDIKVRIRYSISGRIDDTTNFRCRLTTSGNVDTTNIASIKLNQNQEITSQDVTVTLNATGLANNDKAGWDAMRVRVDDTRTFVGSEDPDCTITIYAVDVLLGTLAGNDLTETRTDPVGISDPRVIELATTRTDPVGISDSLTAALSIPRTDPVGVADTAIVDFVPGGVNLTETRTDVVGLSDTSVRSNVRTATEPVGIADTAAAVAAMSVSSTDLVGVTYTAVASKAITVAVADAVGVIDTSNRALSLVRSDPVAVVDSATVTDGWITFPDGVNADTGAVVTGLENGQLYEFRVAAVNDVGQGPWSNIAGPYEPQDALVGIDGGYWGIPAF
jgi:hypothetical protein